MIRIKYTVKLCAKNVHRWSSNSKNELKLCLFLKIIPYIGTISKFYILQRAKENSNFYEIHTISFREIYYMKMSIFLWQHPNLSSVIDF